MKKFIVINENILAIQEDFNDWVTFVSSSCTRSANTPRVRRQSFQDPNFQLNYSDTVRPAKMEDFEELNFDPEQVGDYVKRGFLAPEGV